MISERPFSILGLQQIALGSLDKTKMRKLWVDLLGAQEKGSFKSEKENVDEDIFSLGKPALGINLMQPINPNKKPKVNELPLNHIGLWVDDLEAAYEWLKKQGVRFTDGGIRKGGSGYDVCFIHPKSNEELPISGNGVLIELVQAPQEICRDYYENQ